MNTKPISYQRHRYPAAIISYAVWLYHRFSHGVVSDLEGIGVRISGVRDSVLLCLQQVNLTMPKNG